MSIPDPWTLITVTHNSAAKLAEYWSGPIPSHVEWIVVDNGSADASVAIAESLGARVLPLIENVGFGAANNRGLELASHSLIGFVNPDVTVDFSSLGPMSEILSETAVLLSPQLSGDNGDLQPNGRGLPTIWAKIFTRLRPESPSSGKYLLVAEPNSLMPVHWLIGAVVLSTRRVFEQLGPWDERFFLYYEDADIGLRAWKSRTPVWVDGSHNWLHGWARETTQFKFGPWRREIASMAKFYSRYPALLFPRKLALLFSADFRSIGGDVLRSHTDLRKG